MKPHELVAIVLSLWSTVIGTIALAHELKKDKKKTAPRPKPSQSKRRKR